MKDLSLAARLLLAFGFVAIVSTMSVGLWVRGWIHQSEDERFARQVQQTHTGLKLELEAERDAVQNMLHPLCTHDAFVDKTWIDLKAHRLTPGRRVAIQQIVQEETKALRLDELLLVTQDGTVLGAGGNLKLLGTKQPKLAALLSAPQNKFNDIQLDSSPHARPSLLGRCITTDRTPRIGLIGRRSLSPLLQRLAQVYGVRIVVAGSSDDHTRAREVSSPLTVEGIPEARFVVFSSRAQVDETLDRLDHLLAITALTTLAGALLIALLLARGLARPLAQLAEQVRAAVSEQPGEVLVTGTPEVRTVAQAFNSTMQALEKMRRRHAAMERIAAWREVARRVAHEIKNPLTPIRTSIETLRRLKAREDPKFDDYFDQATRNVLDEVLRIASIASSFSKFARLPQPRLAHTDLPNLVKDTVSMHQTGDVPIELNVSTCNPALADRDQLVQVLTNLLQNAMDASRQHHLDSPETARVLVRTYQESEQWLVIEVHDNGPGIPPDLAEKIFQPYVTTKEHGSGLGLPIVQRIVVEHNGELSFHDSEKLGGTCFTVRIPALSPSD